MVHCRGVGRFSHPPFCTQFWFQGLFGSSRFVLGMRLISKVRADGSTGWVVRVWYTVVGLLVSIGTKLPWRGSVVVAIVAWICLSFGGMVFCCLPGMVGYLG